MDKIGPFFKCSKCGSLYNADLYRRGELLSTEEIAKLRAAWYKASDALFSPAMEKFDKLIIPFEAAEDERPSDYKSKQLVEIKTLSAYLNAKQEQTDWRVPDNLVSVNSKGGYRLECRTHHENKP